MCFLLLLFWFGLVLTRATLKTSLLAFISIHTSMNRTKIPDIHDQIILVLAHYKRALLYISMCPGPQVIALMCYINTYK